MTVNLLAALKLLEGTPILQAEYIIGKLFTEKNKNHVHSSCVEIYSQTSTTSQNHSIC